MDEGIDRMMVSVRADTAAFVRDVAAMRAELDGSFGAGADRAGRALETALARAVRTGKLGFEDLKRTALSVLGEIAAASVRGGIEAILAGTRGPSIGGLLAGLTGAPGRATGGPVSPLRPYWVGERGPELFVPTASGSVVPASTGAGGRDVRVAITIAAPGGEAPAALQRSSRQVARAVRQAMIEAEY